MDSVGFEVSRWDHWLLVMSFIAIASAGLWLSWQWRSARDQPIRRRRSRQICLDRFSDQFFDPFLAQSEYGLSAQDLSRHVLDRVAARRRAAPPSSYFASRDRWRRAGRTVGGKRRTL